MKTIFAIFIILFSVSANAQLTLSAKGFNSVTVEKPNKTNDDFIELARSWAANYNIDIDYPYEISNITSNSFDIDGQIPNAFFYINHGEAAWQRVKYTIHVQLKDKTYIVTFTVKEIYTSDVLTDLTVASLFDSENRLKDDFRDAKPSLEKSVNGIVKSFIDYMATY